MAYEDTSPVISMDSSTLHLEESWMHIYKSPSTGAHLLLLNSSESRSSTSKGFLDFKSDHKDTNLGSLLTMSTQEGFLKSLDHFWDLCFIHPHCIKAT